MNIFNGKLFTDLEHEEIVAFGEWLSEHKAPANEAAELKDIANDPTNMAMVAIYRKYLVRDASCVAIRLKGRGNRTIHQADYNTAQSLLHKHSERFSLYHHES